MGKHEYHTPPTAPAPANIAHLQAILGGAVQRDPASLAAELHSVGFTPRAISTVLHTDTKEAVERPADREADIATALDIANHNE